MYKRILEYKLDKRLDKLSKKNPKIILILDKKINEILENPHRFKSLRASMKNIKRVHIEKHFVLTFEILENNKSVKFLDFNHHDNIYKQ